MLQFLSIDPSDDKTFWYTNMYCPSTSQRNWTTRIATFTIDDLEVGVCKNQMVEKKGNHLKRIFPNPFSLSTTLEWTLTEPSEVRIMIMDLTGKPVAVPVNKRQQAGDYKLNYYALGLVAGVYVCQFIAGSDSETRKLVVVR